MDLSKIWHIDYVENQYRRWKDDPGAVSGDWRFFFEGFELADGKTAGIGGAADQDYALKQSRVEALIYRYRDLGHLLTCLDPLSACPTEHPLLSLAAFNLTEKDLDTPFFAPQFSKSQKAPLREILQALKATYCQSVGIEYMHLQDPAERKWLQERMEPNHNRPDLSRDAKVRLMKKLYQAALFESFLHKKYIGQTRFSLEGAEVLIPMLDYLLEHLAIGECREIILGMAHRGRLNVLTHILKKPYEEIFYEFNNCYDPEGVVGAGDVKYHNGYLNDVSTSGNQVMRVFLMNNPSHLESVNPVAEGFVRARQDLANDARRSRILPLLIHGDAAFSGQGIVAETLNFSQLEGYQTGGTVHLVINNQIGYTTLPENARSTRYATDIAKMLMVPIFHVHGENPEAAVHVTRLACDYRMMFGKDVVIDVVCYRRYGHNEGDDPYFTQPLMYEQIKARPPLHEQYSQKLAEGGVIQKEAVDKIARAVENQLEKAFELSQTDACPFPTDRFYENWQGFHGTYPRKTQPTGVPEKKLTALGRKLNDLPKGFSIHPRLARVLEKRREAIEQGKAIDWAGAEALAFASLLSEGIPIRLSGQDSARGTFSQRHSVLFDTQSGKPYVPLNHLEPSQAAFSVYNSLLAEAGILGFEYGYSLAQPGGLTLWEAQFGDFANNAQAVIDLYIASGESKWQRLSGLVLLLPHGYEGLGPEHSSARLERFLQLCAEDNLVVCNPSTPAQYFHMLRRQVIGTIRKPLVVMTPKSLLRHPLAVSGIEELSGGIFQEIIDDPKENKTPRSVLLCSGKIYYDLVQKRPAGSASDIAICRLEQLYPFPEEQLRGLRKKYARVRKWIWVQEEPKNMGAWSFVRPKLEVIVDQPIAYSGRKTSASTATGFKNIYQREQAAIIETALAYGNKAPKA